jgi:PPK2 family polyphosphate:nucleotide phosphotransferase
VHKVTPAKGMVGIFNRSHYEDVLVVRVHKLITDKEAERRFEEINRFEKLLTDNGTAILKFFLHISKDEQKKRLQERLEDPQKYWKVNPTDLKEREHWDEYEQAYEDVFRNCSTKYAPWYIIPANKKWFRNVVISQTILDTLSGLHMKYPKPAVDVKKLKVV